jgi:tetratricopeptide (TPR) repeat protein
MPALPLKLRVSATPLPVCAGWLQTADVRVWLSEARRIMEAAPGVVVRFYPLAASAQNQTAAGAILTIKGNVPNLDRLFSPQVQRLGEGAPGVLMPVEARLEPALTDPERHRHFPWSLHFFHPVLGLTGFEEHDGLTPSQLLSLPPVERQAWFAAVPGPQPLPGLKQITLVQELSLEDLLQSGAEDIGSERPDKPGAGSSLLEKAGGYAAGALGALGAGLMGALGQGKAAAAMQNWSRRQLEELQDRRKKEINKLLDRFDKGDVLDALRHAIPLSGAESRRGNAEAPGWKLGMRNPDLTMCSHGGGVVDVWNIASDTRLKLEKRYRDAAAREAAAGEFGRAAYIYGELLGDWNRAAEMLEKAGRPREAARIYTERLCSGLRAAQCLEKAGLLAEAAVLYQEAGQPEKAGDVLALMGQEAAAREQWERALLLLSNPIEKAKLLENKLQDPERALHALRSGWPTGGQAVACFEAWTGLLQRLGRHGEIMDALAGFSSHRERRLQPPSTMVSGLLTLFLNYPDSGIRDAAAALAPVIIGESLAAAPERAEAECLLKFLPQFAPGDKLLARDASRFSLKKHRPSVPLYLRNRETYLRPSHTQQLEAKVIWESISSFHQAPHVAGWTAAPGQSMDRICWVSGSITPKQKPEPLSWPLLPAGSPGTFHFLSGRRPVHHSSKHKLATWVDFAGIPHKLDCLAVGPDGGHGFIALRIAETGTLLVTYHNQSGLPARDRVLDFAPPGMAAANWFTGTHGTDIWIAGKDVVCCVTDADEFQHLAIHGPVTAFAIAPDGLPSQAIAVGNSEVVRLIPQGKGKAVDCVNLYSGSAARPPVVAFTGGGNCVIADAKGGVVYHLRDDVRKKSEIVIPNDSGELIAATGFGSGFAFLTSTGKVLRYGD